MGRWEPDAKWRLALAAMELYRERGFERTTVADIAAHAGLTERTFFRHFGDKREVLFAGAEEVTALLATTVAEAPADAAPIEAVGAAFVAVATRIQPNRERSLLRAEVIAATPELRERELAKLAGWADVLAEALRARGVREPAAGLTAQAGLAAFHVAFARWVVPTNRRTLPRLVRDMLDELPVVTAR